MAEDSDSRFEISPRDHPRDVPYIGCVSVWGLVILVLIVVSIVNDAWGLAIFGGVIFLAVIPYLVSQWNRSDLLRIESDSLVVSKSNPLNPGKSLHKENRLELTIEHVRNEDGVESTSTLNLWDNECGYRRRTLLGLWLSEESKIQVLRDLVDFLRRHDFEVDYRIETNTRREGGSSGSGA